ncbi:MAG: ribonuclease H [Gemmatimonadota bacterium]
MVHADEACLGNGTEPPNPGGAGGLVEMRRRPGVVERRDYYTSEPDTTNNRMALRSAILALDLLGARGRSVALEFVSDSQYLVRGMTEWLPGWRRREWRKVKNPELWQELADLAETHEVCWRWVRGHAENPKNEYADFLATTAAREQRTSGELIESGFEGWLRKEREKEKYLDFDPDAELLLD